MPEAATAHSSAKEAERKAVDAHYATQRRRQLTVLLVIAAAILLISVLHAGPHNIFLPNWWRIDLP